MKVILRENVPNLGELGTTVNVSDGYARNFLFPRKLAVSVESGNAKQIEHEMRLIRRREEKYREELNKKAGDFSKAKVTIRMRAGENDRLFGSVTTSMIAQHLNDLGYEVDRKNIVLDEPLKALGVFTVPIRLGLGVEAQVKVRVDREEEAPAEEAETPKEAKAAKKAETAEATAVAEETAASEAEAAAESAAEETE